VPRSLVVNADDLGLTMGVNTGIFEAHDRGILTSASLFANAAATADAIRHAHVRPSLGVGCHLSLVDGQPTLSPTRVPTLVADDGRFRPSWKPFIVACLRGRVSLGEVERELTAQIDRLRSDGITLTHLDAHKHVHAFPPIFAIVARLAERFKIPVVRVPFERWSPFAGRGVRLERQARRQALLNFAMWPWAHRDYRAAAAYGLRTPNVAGRIHTGVLNAAVLKGTLQSLRAGVTELMVHPGYVDEALSQTATRLLTSRAREVDLLCAPETWDLIVDERLDLIRHDPIFSTKRSLRHVS
jgi:predicted glycoside hydrolase/deacetylase ChbG (UPF0249 family)